MWFGIVGIITLILGFLYFFKPEVVKKMDEFGKSIIVNMDILLKHHKKIGLFCAIAGIILIYVGFF